MKVGKLVLEILRIKVIKENAKKCKALTFDPKYRPHQNIPYIDDGHEHHKFDLYFTPNKDKKKCLVIDIHGGAYMFGHRQENYTFGTVFLDAGFDFVATDYIVNNGHMDTLELIDQNIKCICYIISHLKELGLDEDYKFALTGDSAGGHIAITIAELFSDKEYQRRLGYDLPDIDLVAVLVNCSVFNYSETGFDSMTKRANKRMFGPDALDREKRKLICPRYNINSLNVPLFASTCKHDFIRATESIKIKETLENTDKDFEFLDLDTDAKGVGHVHNILDINNPYSKQVNEAMIKFIDKHL